MLGSQLLLLIVMLRLMVDIAADTTSAGCRFAEDAAVRLCIERSAQVSSGFCL